MDYESACRELLKSIKHCYTMIEILKDTPAAKEPLVAETLDNTLLVLSNTTTNVSQEILKSFDFYLVSSERLT